MKTIPQMQDELRRDRLLIRLEACLTAAAMLSIVALGGIVALKALPNIAHTILSSQDGQEW